MSSQRHTHPVDIPWLLFHGLASATVFATYLAITIHLVIDGSPQFMNATVFAAVGGLVFLFIDMGIREHYERGDGE